MHINRAWQQFANTNPDGNQVVLKSLGSNYLEVCDNAAASGSPGSAEIAEALRAVLHGEDPGECSFEYPCHAPSERRWFVVTISGFGEGIERYAVVAHRNVTERKLAHEALHELNETLEKRVAERTHDLEQAYRTLHASEERMRSLFENAAVGIVVCASDGTILNVNDAALQLAGIAREAALGSNLFELGHPDDRNLVEREFRRVFRGDAPGTEFDVRSGAPGPASGRWRHVALSAVHGPTGSVDQVIALVIDQGDRKALEMQRDLFFRRTRDLLVVASLDGRFYLPNPACSAVLGYSEEELCALNYFDLVHPDDIEVARQRLATLADGGVIDEIDTRMRTKSGEWRDINWHSSPWTEPGKVLAVGRDLTDIRRAEREITARSTMLQRAEQMAQMGSWQYEFAKQSVNCSDGLQAIACRDNVSADVGLDELLTFVVAADRDKLQNSIRRVGKSGEPERIECRIQRPSGEVRTVQTSIDARRNARGRIDAVIGACLDITDMNETLQRLRFSERQMRALTQRLEQIREEERAAISREVHDELGQILTALKIDLTLLRRDVEPGDDTAIGTTEIAAALKSMEELVDSTISSVRSIATQLRPEVLDAFGLVSAIEWHAGEFQKRTQIRCKVDANEEQADLDGETRTAMFRITQEAMTNAARHARADEVVVRLRREEGCLRLCIRDNGRGVSADELAKTKSLGVLGMRERAAMVGATFTINGEPGRGTEIVVELPLEDDVGRENETDRASA